MGRLSNIRKETSTFVRKDDLVNDGSVFTITDISERDGEFKGRKTEEWVLTVIIEGAEKKFSLGKGGRDAFMLGLQDSIAAEGPIENCILCKQGMFFFIDEATDVTSDEQLF